MPPFLTGIAAKLIGVAIIAGVIGTLYFLWQGAADQRDKAIAEKAVVESQLADSLETNRKNVAEFAAYKDIQNKTLDALAAQHAADQVRLATAGKLKQEIAHAKPADDGPVAAVLAHTLDGLRQPPGAAPANPNPN
ncbi:MAG TPA: hypothetical protein VHQ39_08070 [Dongiaceae bacterium]|jgi:nitrogen fixation-related uncharacterized protein|nr:hypothetical protein [Dongiaceae bacterium]